MDPSAHLDGIKTISSAENYCAEDDPEHPGYWRCWYAPTLWAFSEGLPVIEISVPNLVETLALMDQDFQDTQRVLEADLSYPIILSPAGYIMDGHHRLAKALLEKRLFISAVLLTAYPEPDWLEEAPDRVN